MCVWGGVLPVVFPEGSEPKRGSLVGRARGFLLPPFAGACIVSEEGSSCGVVVVVAVVVVVDVQVLVVVAVAVCVLVVVAVAVCVLVVSTLGLLGLPALPRGLLLGQTCLDALLRWIATWPSPTPTHTHSIFCLLSLTPHATNAMRFCSRFILSIRTRRHRPLVLTQPSNSKMLLLAKCPLPLCP